MRSQEGITVKHIHWNYIIFDKCRKFWNYAHINQTTAFTETQQKKQQQLKESCFCCENNTFHVEPKQPPNSHHCQKINYLNNKVSKTRSMIHLDLNITLGSFTFNLNANIYHHGPSMCCGYYITSVSPGGNTLHCNDDWIVDCDIS